MLTKKEYVECLISTPINYTCRSGRAQRNHIACCYHAWLSMKMQAKNAKISVYRLQKELLKPFLIQIIANQKVVALI